MGFDQLGVILVSAMLVFGTVWVIVRDERR